MQVFHGEPFLLHVTDKIYVTCDDKCKLRLGREEGHRFALTTLPAGKRSAAVGGHGGGLIRHRKG